MTSERIILLSAALLLLFWGIGAYKRLVQVQNQVRNAHAQINVQLTLRHELVPVFVEAAKACMQQDRELPEAVIEACDQAVSAHAKAAADSSDGNAMQQMAAAEERLGSSLDRLLAVAEGSPELKADQAITQHIEDLRITGNRIVAARQVYNDSVTQYNGSRRQFPVSFIAFLFAFKPAQPFQVMSAHEPKQASP